MNRHIGNIPSASWLYGGILWHAFDALITSNSTQYLKIEGKKKLWEIGKINFLHTIRIDNIRIVWIRKKKVNGSVMLQLWKFCGLLVGNNTKMLFISPLLTSECLLNCKRFLYFTDKMISVNWMNKGFCESVYRFH